MAHLPITNNQTNTIKVRPQHKQAYEQLLKRVNYLEEKVSSMQRKVQRQNHIRKKMRRRAREIVRNYECKVSECGKIYGSQTSLKNHLKLKHNMKVHRTTKQASEQQNKNENNHND